MEKRFYRPSKSGLDLAAAKLAATIRGRGQSVGIMGKSSRLQDISDALWREFEFEPHSLGEPDAVSMIHLSNDIPQGDILLVLDDQDCETQADILCYLFHAVDSEIVAHRRECWREWAAKGEHLTYWAENDQGAWEKLAEENPPQTNQSEQAN